ncbi:TRAP transporter small permease [Arhodomonas sp. SL1]|uniref:TRAP transporter small permease n=1 Tax=Arhodomonas sp. SL1 TaxID=3425691 RepID=UPI003F88536F
MTALMNLLSRALAVIGATALAGLLGLAVLDILLRAVGYPVPGSYEIIGWLAAVAMAAAVGHTQAHRGHVAIDLLLTRLPARLRDALEAITMLLSIALFALASWQLFQHGVALQASGSSSGTLKAPVYPWVYATATGMAALTLVLTLQLGEHLRGLITHAAVTGPDRRGGGVS